MTLAWLVWADLLACVWELIGLLGSGLHAEVVIPVLARMVPVVVLLFCVEIVGQEAEEHIARVVSREWWPRTAALQ